MVGAGTVLSLYVDIVGGSNLKIQWQDSTGLVPDSDKVSIQYKAPDIGGNAFITVIVSDKDGNVVSSTTQYEIISAAGMTSNAPTSQPVPMNTSVETETVVSTPSPTATSVISQNCFDDHSWVPYELDKTITTNNDCWNLSGWGLTGESNAISFHPAFSASSGQSHGIYRQIPLNSEISFTVTINKLDLKLGLSGYIGIGIINMNLPGPAKAG